MSKKEPIRKEMDGLEKASRSLATAILISELFDWADENKQFFEVGLLDDKTLVMQQIGNQYCISYPALIKKLQEIMKR